jgi:hypothetical protein
MSSSSVLINVLESASGSIAWEQTPGAEDGCHHHHANSNRKEGKLIAKSFQRRERLSFMLA